jgi:hypothetical protein
MWTRTLGRPPKAEPYERRRGNPRARPTERALPQALLLSRGSRRLFRGQTQYPCAWEAAVALAELFATEVRPVRPLT